MWSSPARTLRPVPPTPLITDPRWQRQEANSYVTYPEWHIVFAYDGLAHTVAQGDEHRPLPQERSAPPLGLLA